MAIDPAIHVRKDGPFFRVLVLPPDAIREELRRPDSYASAPSARMAAKILFDLTGWPVTDLTVVNTS